MNFVEEYFGVNPAGDGYVSTVGSFGSSMHCFFYIEIRNTMTTKYIIKKEEERNRAIDIRTCIITPVCITNNNNSACHEACGGDHG